ncbi:C40 family peptidase [Vibrio parahaemolyticus]|uniref:NlpC/P60 family protein n=1 Tax=Vibrio parahaemolyticus TaxID=670 RepID=UPI00280CAED1|nr:C40 family peptidase [Vibrio parahaemolyticus]
MNADEVIDMALRVPYVPGGRDLDGWDCYGSVRWVYYQLTGVLMPEFPAISHKESMTTQRAAWSVHEHVEECQFQPLALAAQYKGRRWEHIGLVLPDRRIIHACDDINETTIHRRSMFEMLKPVTKYYQWKN